MRQGRHDQWISLPARATSLAVASVLSLLTALLIGGATPAAALTTPVVNGPVFNDPLGTAAQQKAIFTQLVRLIEATPAGLLDRHRPRRQRLRDHLPHSKQMMIDGDFNGATTPRVYTGSANLTGSSLRSADEAIVRITSASYHARYLSTFYKIRSACGG